MDVLARIPELPPACTTAAARRVDGPGSRAVPAAVPAVIPRGRGGRRPRIENASIVALAVIAAAVWSVVAWRERDRPAAERAAIQMARQTGAWSSSVERTH